MHTPFETRLKYKADFRVSYRFYTAAEGGREMPPFQGYRSDFWYQHPAHSEKQIFMIWPEFEENGTVITNTDKYVPKVGEASMWILMPEMHTYHKDKIKIGLKGFFMEGSRRVAECEIIEIVDLYKNSTEAL
jgi:hypothetical protein